MTRSMQGWWLAAMMAVGAATCRGQQALPEAGGARFGSTLQGLLARLGEEALTLERLLPNFSCEESVRSQELRGRSVRSHVEFTATVRAQRQADGRLNESFQILTVGGLPFADGRISMPLYVSGGFDQAMRYFHPDQQHCYKYTLSAGRIDFKGLRGGPPSGCKETELTGFARLDADGNVVYLERHVQENVDRRLRLVSYAAWDFAPVTLGETTYWLSRRLVAERPSGKSLGRFEAEYRNCRLFKSTVTIGPPTLPEDAAKP